MTMPKPGQNGRAETSVPLLASSEAKRTAGTFGSTASMPGLFFYDGF